MNQVSKHGLQSVPTDTAAMAQRRAELHRNVPESIEWDERELDQLLTQANQINCPADTVLMKPDTMCSGFIIILEGSVRIYQNATDGREITLYRIKPGDVCVMSLNSLLKEKRFNAVARAETPVRAISISKRQFLKIMMSHESFAVRILGTLTENFSKTLSLMEDLVFNRLESRLACLLGSMFEANSGGAIKATHQELANELGTTREVVSRILKNLEQQGCLSLSRGRIGLAAKNSPVWFQRHRNS